MLFFRLFQSGASVSEILISVLALFLAATIAIVMHEYAHGYVAMKQGDYTAKSAGRLTLNPVAHFDLFGVLMLLLVGFGWARPVPINPNNFRNYKKGMISVSIAGVLTNIILAGIGLLLLYFLSPFIGHYYVTTPAIIIMLKMLAYYFLLYLVSINLMLAFFNILPIYPLDGFKLLDVFLKPGNKYSAFMYRYGIYMLLFLLVAGRLFRSLNLWFLDIFGMMANLITRFIFLVA